MLFIHRLLRATAPRALLAAFFLAAVNVLPAAANEVVKWNELALKAAAGGGHNPLQLTRTVAMVQGAVHDALNAIRPRYAACSFEGPAGPGAHPDAAVAAAWRTLLAAAIPAFGALPQRAEAPAQVEEVYDATVADATWNGYRNTPAVSDYPSTQSSFSAAAAVALSGVLGSDQVAFTTTSGPPFANIGRSFTSLSQAAPQCADSRIYSGIHFRTACEDGLALGHKIGQGVVTRYLQPAQQRRTAPQS